MNLGRRFFDGPWKNTGVLEVFFWPTPKSIVALGPVPPLILLICNRHYFFLTNRMRLCVAYSTREYKITILEGHMHEKEEKYKIKLVWLDWYINTSTNQTRRSVGLGHQRDHRLLTRQGNKN